MDSKAVVGNRPEPILRKRVSKTMFLHDFGSSWKAMLLFTMYSFYGNLSSLAVSHRLEKQFLHPMAFKHAYAPSQP